MQSNKDLENMFKICSINIGHNIGHNIGQFLFKLLIVRYINLGHNIRQVFLDKVWMAGNIYQEISTVFISLDCG